MAQPTEASVGAICRHWLAMEPDAVAPHGMPGLSGAPVYAVVHGGRRYALKRFAASATRMHAEWVHVLMRHVRATGRVEVPEVIRGHHGASVLADDHGALWELLEWMEGTPSDAPSLEEMATAATLLARIHVAAATLPGHAPQPGLSPGVQRRIAQAERLLSRPWAAQASVADASPPLMQARLHQAALIVAAVDGRRAVARMAAIVPQPLVLQPVLRDVWSDHVLFAGGQVTGIIDWHAAGVDTPATDIARLLGSWPPSTGAEQAFLSAYEHVRPLEERERGMIAWLRASGVVCALDNWSRWILEERRSFADMKQVEKRVDRLLASLPAALEHLACAGPGVLR